GRKNAWDFTPAGRPGFPRGPPYSKVGWCASDTRELSFAGCRVPAENLLGERGRGYAQFLQILDEGRIAIAALATGLAQGCVDECVRYAGQREAFGRRIGQHQAIAFTVADMEARVAGTGTDTSAHRVFNPTVQGTRFDPDGSYVRRYVPELAQLPASAIHEPG